MSWSSGSSDPYQQGQGPNEPHPGGDKERQEPPGTAAEPGAPTPDASPWKPQPGQPAQPPTGQPGMPPTGQPAQPPTGQPAQPPTGQPGMPPGAGQDDAASQQAPPPPPPPPGTGYGDTGTYAGQPGGYPGAQEPAGGGYPGYRQAPGTGGYSGPGSGGYTGYPQHGRPTNVMAILSLIFAFVFSPLGIVFGYVARSQIRQSGEGGGGLAKAGLILGWIFTVLWLLACIGWIIVIAVAGTDSGTSY